MRTGRVIRGGAMALVVALVFAAPAGARSFSEQFRWQGAHAFTTSQGGEAVWWNQDSWDVRGDTAFQATVPVSEGDPYTGNFTAIEKAAAPGNRRSEAVNEGARAVGGNGSPGIGVMRLDFQGVQSARLRNPMLISAKHPGVVEYDAPLFATTGHWWEVAITPTGQPTAGEYTAVPGRQSPESLNDPLTGENTDGSTNGPGHRTNVQDSVNVISTGYPDGPTCNGTGWFVRWAATSARNGQVTDHVNAKHQFNALHRVDPRDHFEMYHWRIVYRPNKVQLFADFHHNGKLQLVDQWNVQIPWGSVYVNLLYVAYQAGHHPNPACGFHTFGINQAQQTGWRNVSVSPVKYARTIALPHPTTRVNVPRQTGWMNFDLRDMNAHFGAPIGGLAQPNGAMYNRELDYLVCSLDNHGGLPCPVRAAQSVTLRLSITPADLRRLARAQLISDVRYPGNIGVTVNGHGVGTLPGQAHLPDVIGTDGIHDVFEPDAWFRRGINVPGRFLHSGTNTVHLSLDQTTDVDLDRVQLELDQR